MVGYTVQPQQLQFHVIFSWQEHTKHLTRPPVLCDRSKNTTKPHTLQVRRQEIHCPCCFVGFCFNSTKRTTGRWFQCCDWWDDCWVDLSDIFQVFLAVTEPKWPGSTCTLQKDQWIWVMALLDLPNILGSAGSELGEAERCVSTL